MDPMGMLDGFLADGCDFFESFGDDNQEFGEREKANLQILPRCRENREWFCVIFVGEHHNMLLLSGKILDLGLMCSLC